MRIAALGFHHETNTFQSVKTDYNAFKNTEFLIGDEIAEKHANAHSTFAGYFQGAKKYEFDLVPLLFCFTGPTGTITKDAFDRITHQMIELLKNNGPWDGVLLAQHGAAVSEEYHDMDGEVARMVRNVIGNDIPMVMTLDLHSNISHKQVENTDAIVVYRTNPHLDPVERALDACEILVKTISGEVKPTQYLVQLPMIINIVKQPTDFGTMKEIIDDVENVIENPKVLSASCGQCFPYADVEHMGVSFLVVTDNDIEKAEKLAKGLAKRTWKKRSELQNDSPSMQDSINTVINSEYNDKPIVIMDVGDNVGGGGTADSTHLLEVAINNKLEGKKSLLMSFFDPVSVQDAINKGVGGRVNLNVGAKTDKLHGKPIEINGYVRAITDGKFEEPKPIHGGWRFFDYGPSVAIETDQGYTLVIHTERGLGNMSRQMYYFMGIFPEQYKLIICKGTVSPRAAYEPIAEYIMMANSPGVTTADMPTFDFSNIKSLYPFEQDIELDF